MCIRDRMWGRSLYRNIQKFLLFQLTINVAACLIVLLGSLLGTESPLTITQMLWVNLIMDTFAAGALASLPPNERVMKDKPRRSGKDGDFIITRPMAYNIFGVGLAFVIVLMGLLLHFHAQDGLTPHDLSSVSYTHLDVYKRQGLYQALSIIHCLLEMHIIVGCAMNQQQLPLQILRQTDR